jgi:hypothetical protein
MFLDLGVDRWLRVHLGPFAGRKGQNTQPQ